MNEIIENLQLSVDVSVYSTNFIENLIQRRMVDLSLLELVQYKSYILNNRYELFQLQHLLTNAYSCFFRNRLTFETLIKIVLPLLSTQKKTTDEVRVWSAGCAGGQEAYSLAMVFENFNALSSKQLKYRIFATDRAYPEIEHAVMGVYNKNDVANLTNTETEGWFDNLNERYSIKLDLKKNVQFELFDLLSEEHLCPPSSIFGNFDIVMCANVLMYYNQKYQQKIISKLQKSVASSGCIITGEAERDIFLQYGLSEIYPQSCIFKMC